MKVIALNGSPHKNGNTYYALTLVGESLQEEGIEYEIVQVGSRFVYGCMACNKCRVNKNEKCVISTDIVNETIARMKQADGIILSSPVYYSGVAGTMKCFLDRAFYVAAGNGHFFRHKVGASVVALRRTGGSMTFNSLNHYLGIEEMLIPSSNYWNVIHGLNPGDAQHDKEGEQIMRVLGKNMAWLLKMRQQTAASNLEPEQPDKIKTNFIR